MDAPVDAASEAPAEGSAGAAPAPQGQPRTPDGRYTGGTAPAAPPPEKRAFRVKSKSGGEEVLNLTDDEVSQRLALPQEGHHRLRLLNAEREKFTAERAAHEAERASFESLMSDPEKLREYLNKRAKDPDEARRWRAAMVRKDMEEHALSPEERERDELRAFKAQKEKEEQDAAAEKKRREEESALESRAQAIRPQLEKVLTSVLDKGGLPKSPRHMAVVAGYWKDNLQSGVNLDADELAAYAKSEMDADLNARMADPELTDEAFAAGYPDVMKRAERIIRERILKSRGRPGPGADLRREGPSIRPPEEGARPNPKSHSSAEWRALTRGGG